MLNLNVERIGKVAVIHCEGRIVRSDAAFRLRDAVTKQRNARVVLLDLSGVEALEGGGLGMPVTLQIWTRDHGIQFKVCDPPAGVRKSLERTRSAAAVEIVGLSEALALLGWGERNCGIAPEGPRDACGKIHFCFGIAAEGLVSMVPSSSSWRA